MIKQSVALDPYFLLLYSFAKLHSLAVIHAEITEDLPSTGEVAESSQSLVAPPPAVSPPSQERESYKKLGLTKQVLAAHTQKEEQAFLHRFRELRKLSPLGGSCSEYLERQKEQIGSNGTTQHRRHTDTGRIILSHCNLRLCLFLTLSISIYIYDSF